MGRARRSYEWDSPGPTAREVSELSGLDFITAVATGIRPTAPIARTLDFDLIEVADGRTVFSFTPQEFHYNPIGGVHGGMISTVCDSALGCAVHTTLPAGWGYATLDLKVNFLKAVRTDSPSLRCEGRVISRGSRIALAEGSLTDDDGVLYAHATSSCLLIAPPRPRPSR